MAPIARAELPAKLDELTLADGRQVRGHVVEKAPGRWLIVETEDGARRTFAWQLVSELVEAPGAKPAAPPASVESNPWESQAGWRKTYDLRLELAGILQPRQVFALEGNCATGTGVVPASIYGQRASDQGRGGGVGVGGRAGAMYMPRLDYKKPAWFAFRAGGGLDLQMHYLRLPTGIPQVDGELCTDTSKRSHEVVARNRPELVFQIPLNIGGHVGLGSYVDPYTWRGLVLGLAWAPSYLHVGPFTSTGSGQFSPLGVEMTFDFTTLHARTKKPVTESHLRMAATITIPVTDKEALLGTLGFGWVWY